MGVFPPFKEPPCIPGSVAHLSDPNLSTTKEHSPTSVLEFDSNRSPRQIQHTWGGFPYQGDLSKPDKMGENTARVSQKFTSRVEGSNLEKVQVSMVSMDNTPEN